MWKSCNLFKLLIIIISYSAPYMSAIANDINAPRFVSIKSNEVNLRSGPASHYPIKFIYKHKNYPLEIKAEFEQWRLVSDKGVDQGWIHQSLLSNVRYIVIIDNKIKEKKLKSQLAENQALIFRLPAEDSYPILRVEIGVIARVKKCIEHWCQIEFQKKRGWIQKVNLWGVYSHELFDN